MACYSLFPPLVYCLLSSCASPSVHQSTRGVKTAANRTSQPALSSVAKQSQNKATFWTILFWVVLHILWITKPPSSLRICESWKKLKCKWDVFLNLNQTKVGLIYIKRVYVLVRKEDKALWDRTADIHWQSIGGSVLRIAWNERTCTQNRCKIDLFKRWQYSGGNQW